MNTPNLESRLYLPTDKQRTYGDAILTGARWAVEKQQGLTAAQEQLRAVNRRMKAPGTVINRQLIQAWLHCDDTVGYRRGKFSRYESQVRNYIGSGVEVAAFQANGDMAAAGILKAIDYKKAIVKVGSPSDEQTTSVAFARQRPLPAHISPYDDYSPGYDATIHLDIRSFPTSLQWAFEDLPYNPTGLDIYRDTLTEPQLNV